MFLFFSIFVTFSLISVDAIDALLECSLPLGTHLIHMATDHSVLIGSKFVDFLSISTTLAGSHDGRGHLKLMNAVIIWLKTWYVLLQRSFTQVV